MDDIVLLLKEDCVSTKIKNRQAKPSILLSLINFDCQYIPHGETKQLIDCLKFHMADEIDSKVLLSCKERDSGQMKSYIAGNDEIIQSSYDNNGNSRKNSVLNRSGKKRRLRDNDRIMNRHGIDRTTLYEICNHYKIHPMSQTILAQLFSALPGYNYEWQEIQSQDRLMEMFNGMPSNVESISQYVVQVVDDNLYLSMQEDDALAEENVNEDENKNENNNNTGQANLATATNGIE